MKSSDQQYKNRDSGHNFIHNIPIDDDNHTQKFPDVLNSI